MITAQDNGIIDKPSNHAVEQTVDRIKNILQLCTTEFNQ